ncbi:hypothetical protein [Nostoc sp. FACHB-133]|uniref:hypothetical protein n=1 Tax=Nostoc sp. FACHB-133 TaxID=2692835 RepID=UPI00168450B0|nr:hypothetical protein [Nostoc sp. FACHB-133]MBD2525904.1 hypothetical protein [Nostoc sp. FACHB-133]
MTTAILEVYRISGYKLIEILYQGFKAKVYRAIRMMDQQPVVIKILQLKSHTGTLKVNSTFGQGSEFEITLPIGN